MSAAVLDLLLLLLLLLLQAYIGSLSPSTAGVTPAECDFLTSQTESSHNQGPFSFSAGPIGKGSNRSLGSRQYYSKTELLRPVPPRVRFRGSCTKQFAGRRSAVVGCPEVWGHVSTTRMGRNARAELTRSLQLTGFLLECCYNLFAIHATANLTHHV